jgi:hypothetical protein
LLDAVEIDETLELRRRLPGGDDVIDSLVDVPVDVRDDGLLSGLQGRKTLSSFREIARFTTRGLVSLVAAFSSANIADADIVFLSIPGSSSCSAWHCPRFFSVCSRDSA